MTDGMCDRIRTMVYEQTLEECREEVEAMEGLSETARVLRLAACERTASDEGDRAYGQCIRTQSGVSARRDEMMLDCLEAGYGWETCAKMVFDGPRGAPGITELEIPDRSLAVRRELFDDPDKVKTVSSLLVKAFAQVGLQLQADETWACLLFVIRRPTYISQLLPAGSEAAYEAALPRMNLILEPDILSQVIEAMERDKLK
jgi:hypothetical protein